MVLGSGRRAHGAPAATVATVVGALLLGAVPAAGTTTTSRSTSAATADTASFAWGNCGWRPVDLPDGVHPAVGGADLHVREDGRVMVLGSTSDLDPIVVSHQPDGAPDPTWGERGVALVQLPKAADTGFYPSFQPTATVGLADGGLAVAGTWTETEGSTGDVGLVRLRADGSLDTGFGSGGVTVVGTDEHDDLRAVAAGSGGRLYVLYQAHANPGGEVVVEALAPDGSVDTGFAGGHVALTVDGEELPSDLVVTSDGRPWVLGYVNGAREAFLARWTVSGAPDTSLGGTGLVRHLDVIPRWQGRSAGLDGEGGLVVAAEGGARLIRFTSDGSRDASYGTDGEAVTGITGEAAAFSAGHQGAVVLALGETVGSFGSPSEYTLVRFDETGRRVAGFGQDGRLLRPTTFEGLSGYRPSDATLAPDGEVVVVGAASWMGGDTYVTERFRSDGSRDALDCPDRQTQLQVVRRYGGDRYATAAAISAGAFPRGAPVAFVATGRGFADALAAGPAAAHQGGPVLLVERDAVPSATAKELQRLRPQRVVVVGGSTVIAGAVVDQLRQYAGTVTRIEGKDRFETAAKLAQAVFPRGVEEVLLATGSNFPDALAGGAAAGAVGGTILLVTRDTIPAATDAALRVLRPDRIATLGGPGVISWELFEELQRRFPDAEVTNLAGVDRYSTATRIARHYFDIPWDDPVLAVHTAYLATGTNFPDALAGAAAAGVARSPLVLTPPDRLGELARETLAAGYAARVVLLGGTTALSSTVEQQLKVPGVIDHRFLNYLEFSTPDVYTRWNPCEPIRWVYNPENEPSGGRADLDEAIRRLEKASGLTFAYQGTTTEPWDANRDPYQPGRYGERWAPVWIGWASLGWGAGQGGHTYVDDVAVTGVAVLDPNVGMAAGFSDPYAYGPVFMHELGHLVGLAHVASSREIMHAEAADDGATDWATGDLLGLKSVGRAAGCLEVPDPSTVHLRTASSVVLHDHRPAHAID